MNYKKLYPITIPMVEDHYQIISTVFDAARPHKEGNFIGVGILEGSFYIKNRQEIYESLAVGEKISLTTLKSGTIYSYPIIVTRNDGTELGYIPDTMQGFLSMFFDNGIDLFGFIEAKSYDSDILKIAVSVYCEDY